MKNKRTRFRSRKARRSPKPGTTVKFTAPQGQDTVVKNGVSQTISTKHQCIAAMKEYEGKSLEELRFEDYTAGKGKTHQNKLLFGELPATQSSLVCGTATHTYDSESSITGGFGRISSTNVTQSVSLTRVEIELETLKATNAVLTARVVALEKMMKLYSNQLGLILQAREEIETMREQLQGLSGMVRQPTTCTPISVPDSSFGTPTTTESSKTSVSGFRFGTPTTTESSKTPVSGSSFGIPTTTESSKFPVSGFRFGTPTTTESSKTPVSGFRFGTPTTTESSKTPVSGFRFGTPTTTESSKTPVSGFRFGTPTTTESSKTPVSGFSFGTPTSTESSKTPVSGFGFGIPTTTESSKTPVSGFSFGTPTSTESSKTPVSGFSFGTLTTTESSKTPVSGFRFGTPTTTESSKTPVSGFRFGTPTTTESSKTPVSGFSFRTPSPAIDGSLTFLPKSTFETVSKIASGFQFRTPTANETSTLSSIGNPDNSTGNEISFSTNSPGIIESNSIVGGQKTSCVRVSSDVAEDNDDDDCTQDYTEDKKGDEDEISVFSNEAKLFRFDRGSDRWKEKGVGDMKILQHKETNEYRLLLCREEVYKLACNHLLSPSIKMTAMPTSKTSWCWTAVDYADGKSKLEQLAVEFKSIEVAQRFKEKVDEILENFKD